MKIPWDAAAEKMGLSNAKQMWEKLYLTDKQSLAGLATFFGVTRNTVRRELRRHGIPLRGRGGPQGVKLKIGDEQLEQEVLEYGTESVAAHYDVSRTAVFHRMRKIRARRAEEEKERQRKDGSS